MASAPGNSPGTAQHFFSVGFRVGYELKRFGRFGPHPRLNGWVIADSLNTFDGSSSRSQP
jgi:uncharacterized membrane protein YtjA (UPF0391 family)